MALSTPWRIHAVLPRSLANGPGTRFAIWSQGCSLGCAGCFNPATHDTDGPATTRTAGDVLDAVLADAAHLDGVTLTGGEPLQQPAAVAAFCAALRAHSDLGIVMLTGFTRREIAADPARWLAVAHADMIITGRYRRRRRVGAGLRGSSNKAYWARTGRYRPDDFAPVPEVEIVIGADGTFTLSGTPVAPVTGETRA